MLTALDFAVFDRIGSHHHQVSRFSQRRGPPGYTFRPLAPRRCRAYYTNDNRSIINLRETASLRRTHPTPRREPRSLSHCLHHFAKDRSILIRRIYARLSNSHPSIPRPEERTVQKSTSGWIILLAIGISGGSFFYTTSHRSSSSSVSSTTEQLQPTVEFSLLQSEKRHNMTGEALPGRPGTLTPEQEEILRRFWSITLQVFGALDDQQDTNGNKQDDSPSLYRKTTDLGKAEKPKKKKYLFSRKNKDFDTESVASSASTVVAADPEDKYGQTKQFHDTLASLSPGVIRETFWSMVKHDHPDALLLRFLRARKWDVERALVMMVSTMHWRAKEMHVDDDIMHSGEEGSLLASKSTDPAIKRSGEDFLAQMRMGKSYLHGTDKAGRPMCFIRARLHKQGEQEEPSLERYTVYVIETARMMLSPPVDTAVGTSQFLSDKM
jgi:hypothetical protein